METFRDRTRRMFRKYRAILILLNHPSTDEMRQLEDSLANIDYLSGPELRRQAREIQEAYDQIVQKYGVTGTAEEFEQIVEESRSTGKAILYVSRFDIEHLFKHYDRLFPAINSLPPHGRIGLDTYGARPDKNKMEMFPLEASLFEDMAILWNAAADATDAVVAAGSYTKGKKHAAALRRATAKAAFNLLEGYLNGLALDVQLIYEVPQHILAKLQEWDDARGKPVRLSLRDKILQYPKIALQSSHPPIQESTTPELGRVLAAEGRVRHALIHPTPRAASNDPKTREVVYINLTLQEVREMCDDVVALIRRIADVVGPAFGTVGWWAFSRDANDRYDEDAFA